MHSLNNLLDVYTVIENSNKSWNSNQRIIELVIRLIVGFTVEFRSRRISIDEKKCLDDFIDPNVGAKVQASRVLRSDSEDSDFPKEFAKKYFPTDLKMVFVPCLFEFVTSGKLMNEATIDMELENVLSFIETKANYDSNDDFFNELYFEKNLLTHNEYKSAIKKLVFLAKQGRLSHLYYVRVFQIATRYNNILNFNKNDLVKNLIAGIKRVPNSAEPSTSIIRRFFTYEKNDDNYEYLEKIKNELIRKNDSIIDENIANEAKRVLNLFYEDTTGFIQKQQSVYRTSKEVTIFRDASAHKVFSCLLRLDRQSHSSLYDFLENRYFESGDTKELIAAEFGFWKTIYQKISAIKKYNPPQSIDDYPIWLFGKLAKKIIERP